MPEISRRVQRSAAAPGGLRKAKARQAGAAPPAHEASGPASANLRRALLQRGRAAPADLISAQRAMGNRALQRILSEHAAPLKEESARRLSAEKQDEHDLRRAAPAGERGQAAAPEVLGKIEEERGGGRPVDSRVSKHVGRKLGADFSSVRVHTDPRADLLNRAMNSKAFTVGRDIFFRRNAYQPADAQGQHLLTHELIHVVQQGGDKSEKVQAKFSVAPAGDQFEAVAGQAAVHVTPRPGAEMAAGARPALGHEAPAAAPARERLKPGARAGVVQRAPAGSTLTGTDRKAKDVRKGDIVLSRRRLLEQKAALNGGRKKPSAGQPAEAVLGGLKPNARIPQGRAFEMIQRLWAGRLQVINPDFAHSALALDQKNVTHTLDGKQIRRDPQDILSGSEVYRTPDKKLAENSVETTKQWNEIAGKLRRAYAKATQELDLTSQNKTQAAVLAAYILAGKLRPTDVFSEEFTSMAHQATALLPAVQQLIEAEEGRRGNGARKAWGKAKDSKQGIQRWVQRNLSKIRLPDKLPIDPDRVPPGMLPAELHALATKNRPKWQYEGLL